MAKDTRNKISSKKESFKGKLSKCAGRRQSKRKQKNIDFSTINRPFKTLVRVVAASETS
jgi:hypothetical protein